MMDMFAFFRLYLVKYGDMKLERPISFGQRTVLRYPSLALGGAAGVVQCLDRSSLFIL